MLRLVEKQGCEESRRETGLLGMGGGMTQRGTSDLDLIRPRTSGSPFPGPSATCVGSNEDACGCGRRLEEDVAGESEVLFLQG